VPIDLTNNETFRLRMLIHVESGTLPKNDQWFKLQFKDEACGSCEYKDVNDDDASAIAFWYNPTPFDGDALLGNWEDPSHDEHTIRNQTYEEVKGFTNAVSTIEVGQDGMWDFSLYVNDASSATYSFRIVKGDGIPLETYESYPVVTIIP
jgi:hypothetical protein